MVEGTMLPFTALALLTVGFAIDEVALETAQAHLAQGRYAEAAEAFEELAQKESRDERVILGRVQSQLAQGQLDEAESLLGAAVKAAPDSPVLLAHRAQLLFERGRLSEAAKDAEAALKVDPDQPLARLIQAHVWTETGDLKKANDGYRWFVRYYNRMQPKDAETLLLVAEGASHYARWNSVSQIFSFVVNTLCADALKDDPRCWQAHAVAGALLLEKYNRGDALPELNAALAINPQATVVHLALAEAELEQLQYEPARRHLDRALGIDPDHPAGLRLKALLSFQLGELDAAEKMLERSLSIQPAQQETLALLAIVHTLRGDQPSAERLQQLLAHLDHIEDWKPADSRFEKLVVELAQRNPRPGYFLNELGRLFEQQRKFALAERCYQQAIVSMPQLSQPKTELGMLYFQTGRLAEAQKLLDDSFKGDPYHVRVSNMRKVLKVLDDYATVTTPHFVIRSDSQLDGVLARYMAEYLEEIYPELTREFGFEPPQRTQIEVYNKAKGQGGHQWFSARMVGLPWLQTIGASTGTIVALTSPAATDDPFNWARVLRHEFVHIITLQQTDFNIPHWLTEALATRAEGYPRPPLWNRLLRERVAKNQLRNLDNLHLGFQRAESQEDWTFAYCQSVLYAEYFIERFGADALPRLLNAYRDTRSTDVALMTAYGAKKADVEAGYLEFLRKRVAALSEQSPDEPRDPAEIRKAYADRPDDLDAIAAFAGLQFRLGKFAEAVQLAENVLRRKPDHASAAVVLALAHLRENDLDEADRILTSVYNPQSPHPRLLALLAQVRLKQDQPADALRLFQHGRQKFPDDPAWLRGIIEAADKAGDQAALVPALEALAASDPDDAGPRVRLAEMAHEAGDPARTVKYAKLALHIDVLDADVHRLLARGFRGMKDWPQALAEYAVAVELKPGEPAWDVEYAEAQWDAGRKDEARARIEALLKKHPDHAPAKALRERMNP
jgi:tetratricopeptide (TPR) repeat protein